MAESLIEPFTMLGHKLLSFMPQSAKELQASMDYLQSVKPFLGVLAVLVVATAQSLLFVYRKPGCPSVVVKRGRQLHYEAVLPSMADAATSPIVSRTALLVWRLVATTYVMGISLAQWHRVGKGTWHMRFYTVWNWYLLCTYFILATLASITYRAPRQAKAEAAPKPVVHASAATSVDELSQMAAAAGGVVPQGRASKDGAVGRFLANAVCVLFHINATTVFIIDFTTWVVLVPTLVTHNKDPVKALFYTKLFFNYVSYSQHGANAVIMMVELMLNAVTCRPYMVGHVGTWSLMYMAWAFLHHYRSGDWLYPFLDTSKAYAPLAYLTLYAAHWIFFLVVWLMFKVKDRLVGHTERRAIARSAAVGKKDA